MLHYKNVCSKQAGSCFLVYYATFLIQKMHVQCCKPNVIQQKVCSKQAGRCFLVYKAAFAIRKMGLKQAGGCLQVY